MAAQSVAPRSRRPRNDSGSDDVVIARALEFSQWARENARIVIGVAVAALVLVGGLVYYSMYRADRLERAAAEFMQLEQTVASGNEALAERDLEAYIRRFEGTVYADEASLLLARTQLRAGEPAAAVAALEPVAEDLGDSPLGVQAALLLAAAQQEAGNTEAAVATYLRIAEEADLEIRAQEALSSAALLREQAGDFVGAAELYRDLVATAEEGTLERSVYEMRLAEAEGEALAQ